jgi:two-component system, CitB family, response regulator DctR
MPSAPMITSHERRPARWRVLIAEDDPRVAELHRRIVDGHSAFSVAATCGDLDSTARALEELEPDLLILDLTMPRGDGVSFLRRARADSVPVDVIVVTASRDASSIRTCMQLGAVEYLVKPFAPQRLHDALISFARRDRTLNRSELAQEDVDALRLSGATLRRLPRGLKRATLRRIWLELKAADEPLTAAQVGERVGVARVTARRYLDYLEAVSLTELVRVPQPVGRPSNRYRLVGRAGARDHAPV